MKNYKKSLNKLYEYPDEDWCLFKSAIYNKNIQLYPDLKEYEKSNISCVLIGFLKNQNIIEIKEYSWYKRCCINNSKYLNIFIQNCNNLKCLDLSKEMNDTFVEFDYYDFVNTIFYLQVIFEYVLQPLISVIGILGNLLIICILKTKNNRKDFKDKIYNYIFYNSFFNLIILLLNFLEYISKCSLIRGLYCPIIRETLAVQYTFILNNFLENFFMSCSNLNLLFFSIERLRNILNDDIKRLSKISNFIDKHCLVLTFFLSFLINFCKLFEYVINKEYDQFNFPTQRDVLDFDNQLICILFFYIAIHYSIIFEFCNFDY